jgi:hypothetical protein
MTARRARAAVARSSEIVDRLRQIRGVAPAGPLRQRGPRGGDVVGRPMMPSAAGRIRVVADKRKAARPWRRLAPFERRGRCHRRRR